MTVLLTVFRWWKQEKNSIPSKSSSRQDCRRLRPYVTVKKQVKGAKRFSDYTVAYMNASGWRTALGP
jgi:hypothetical protein